MLTQHHAFVRGKPAEITDQATNGDEDGKLVVVGEDTLIGNRYRQPVDMVILCAAMEAREDSAEVGRVFGVNQGADGFFLEEHPKLGPHNTATDGVFLACACQGPKDIPDTVAQASGAAAKALELATCGEVEISPCHNCHSRIHDLSEQFEGGFQVVHLWTLICLSLGCLGENEREYLGPDLAEVGLEWLESEDEQN